MIDVSSKIGARIYDLVRNRANGQINKQISESANKLVWLKTGSRVNDHVWSRIVFRILQIESR